MIPLADYIAQLRRAELALKFEMETVVRLGMEEAAKKAKAFIGVQQEGWPELSASTIEEKSALGYPVPAPLLRKGDLRDSIEAETESHAREIVGIVGSSDPIAIYFSTGTSRMPPRPFLEPALMLTEPEIVEALGQLAIRTLTGSRR